MDGLAAVLDSSARGRVTATAANRRTMSNLFIALWFSGWFGFVWFRRQASVGEFFPTTIAPRKQCFGNTVRRNFDFNWGEQDHVADAFLAEEQGPKQIKLWLQLHPPVSPVRPGLPHGRAKDLLGLLLQLRDAGVKLGLVQRRRGGLEQ